MICQGCNVPMLQTASDGGMEDDEYITWTIQRCPECDRKVLEFYAACLVNGLAEPRFEVVEYEAQPEV